MRYVSVFSGVEAATLAFEPLGWEPVCFCEVDDFPSQVLRKRFPRVPNLGDIREVKWKEVLREWGPVDLVVGGSPCQSFSIAGNRTGLEGESGLMWEYVRCVREIMPRWLLWENVPGALSSSNGEDFRCLLESLDDLGYGLAWRVLDAQFFGVPQRRRRVFVVGSLGDRRACEVLLEPESLLWDPPTSREKRAELAAGPGKGAQSAGFNYHAGKSAGGIGYQEELSPTLTTEHNPAVLGFSWNSGGNTGLSIGCSSPTVTAGNPPAVYGLAGNVENRKPENGGNGTGWCDPDENGFYTLTATDRPAVAVNCRNMRLSEELSGTIQAKPNGGYSLNFVNPVLLTDAQSNASVETDVSGALSCHSAKDAPVVAFAANQRGEVRIQNGDGEIAGAVPANQSGKQVQAVTDGYILRRLMPLECERLQGFPDGWTDIEYKGKPAPDTLRYKAIGNSMAVNVMKWIGERIERFDQGGAR